MKAIRVNQPGDISELHFEETPVPQCNPSDVLVEIKAAGINFIDIYIRNGLYKPPHYPYIPGKEGSGVIAQVGSQVKRLKPGDRVAFCSGGTGTYAEFVAIPSEQVVLLPPEISFEVGAAVMLQGLTAYYLSHETFLLNNNHTALIHAGAGGVGLLLIQMAKILGAKVISTVSTDNKADLAKKAGADYTINYLSEAWLNHVLQFTNNEGVDVVYDAVGKTTFEQSMKSLKIRGMLVSYGQASGPVSPILLSQLAEKSLFLTRPTLFHYIMGESLNRLSLALFTLIKEKKLHITIGQRYALKDVALAHTDLENRKTIGKSLLVINH